MSDHAPSALPEIPGGAALIEWYGFVPNFHDGFVLSVKLASDGPGEIRIHTWRMTDRTDEKGYFILDRHAIVIFALEGVTDINLSEFNEIGCISELGVFRGRDCFEIRWDGAGVLGVEGSIRARRISVSFVPGKPAKSGAPWAEVGTNN
ncbi:hypothetical protein [Inquilinus sp. CA228]|uniref:hypothetical protein n=1 Tax=Inquilinus sp. CA228 TaxID=3455609 RepID=UPI003F8D35B9